MKNLSWQQLAALVACLAAPAAAHYLGGTLAGQVTAGASILFAWLTQSPMQPPGPPSAGGPPSLSVVGAALALVIACTSACGAVSVTPADVTTLEGYQQALQHCQDVGRDAGTYAAYANCTAEGGL